MHQIRLYAYVDLLCIIPSAARQRLYAPHMDLICEWKWKHAFPREHYEKILNFNFDTRGLDLDHKLYQS
jgi:hypothetical protein